MKDLQGSLSNMYIYNPKWLPCYKQTVLEFISPEPIFEGPEDVQSVI
jgi:hypothetical protein